ncbi:Tuberous sclerosis 2-like protein [Elasticomyces elasticus]|uniref:Tuberous sclerosis 2-like protein n=1 Tax=Exophiala sideris TaxID=1016849 RepID=A0ABR0JMH2_9EURO|nr:Tuberous sclerosis 2-like protein [Elasticomyces elasticus]KAK5036547.1 Tuberous sclerosis 2-like protein [Exophiala sideris]KAK5041624.1 Tuberous sclerosis 2-like protein [Exophiala sideris]KAK5066930.1 Tuberous sclerosis 2-like protein [Exophiala sideris]KAK5184989.1 Tuberous sclerosis 2-like protein [Eurotiomycetes sp. CCFEE 6388]
MSTENDSTQERPSTTNAEREPRRRSVWHVPVLTPKSHSPDDAALQDRHNEKVPHDQPPPDVRDVLDRGLALGSSPDEARSWLIAFGDPSPGTDVSTRLRGLRDGNDSLLSILCQWIPLWSSRADKSRKDKTSKSTSIRDAKNLDWLLRYISDYIGLNSSRIDHVELAHTVDAITNLCLNARRDADINGGVNVLYTILCHFDFPKTGLEQTLVVLCASAANLQDLPDHLFDCARTLATGGLHREVITTLFTFILTPTLENNSKNLSHARGATRLLRNLIDEQSKEGAHVVNLEEFVEELHIAANQGIFRFSYDILSSLHTILSSEQRRAEIPTLKFGKVMDILLLCLEMTPFSAGNLAQSPVISPIEDNKDRHSEKHYERHYRDRDNMATMLAQDFHMIWEQLEPSSQHAVNDFFLEHPRFADAQQVSVALEYAKGNYLVPKDHESRTQYAHDLYERIVQNQAILPISRIKAVEVLVQATVETHMAVPDTDDQAGEAYVWMLERLLQQLEAERNSQVLAGVLKALDSMVSQHEQAAKEHTSILRAIEKITDLLLAAPNPSLNDECAALATKVVATIFGYSLHTDPKAAVKAFDALQQIAGSRCKFRMARLVAKRILFRLRANEAGFVFLTADSESQSIASALLRTRDSAGLFHYEVPSSQRHSASSTSLSTKSDSVSESFWQYPDTEDVDFPFADVPAQFLNIDASAHPHVQAEIDMDTWLMNIIMCLQADTDWETYSYTIVHVAAQLSNFALFLYSMESVVKLRQVLCEQIVNNTFREAPASTGLKKSDVALCMFNILVPLIPFATMKSEAVQKGFGDDLVRTFLSGLGGVWEGTSRPCIHALSVCSLEIPSSVATLYPTIIDKMSKNMTQAHLTSHILEFLIHMALLPEMHSNLNPDEIQMIFGICIQFLEKTREQHQSSLTSPSGRLNPISRHSGMNFRRPPYRAAMLTDIGLPQYAAALAYHIMIFWFLSLRLETRAKYVSWIVARLVWKNGRGEETIDEQSQVLVDMMQRTAFTDLGETSPDSDFAGPEDGPVSSSSWIVGLSVITAQTAGHTGKTQIIKRQASGTTYARYQQLTTQLPAHHAPSHTEIRHQEATTEMLPSHIILQLVASAATISAGDQPVPLADEDYVKRALELFDRIPTVSSHKVGVLYIGDGQTSEAEYLANTSGTPDFERFLDGLGYVVSLRPPLHYNPQGLEYPRDGENTIAWRNRVDEIVYHVPTMMPTDMDGDPQFITKKSHVGNCHVNVIFNRSGVPWIFDYFQSQLNYVNIVIRPACCCGHTPDANSMPGFYWVQVITREGFPNMSPAAVPKIVSAAQLGPFVRAIALNASMFSSCWNSKDIDPEFPSTWRARLQQIKRLRERVTSKMADKQVLAAPSGTASSGGPNASAGRRTPVPRDEAVGPRKDVSLASQLDFSSWTTMQHG